MKPCSQELKSLLGCEVVVTRCIYKERVFIGRLSIIRPTAIFLSGDFLAVRGSKLYGGCWIERSNILSIEKQQEEEEEVS